MRRRLWAALTALALVLAAAAPAGTAAATVSAVNPLRVMTMGDSITRGDGTLLGSYRGELGRLLDLAGQPVEFSVAAVGETTCDYWVSRATALVQQYQPDLVLLSCGTNNFPGTAAAGAAFEAVYRQLLQAILAGSPTVRVITSFVQYSATGPGRAWSGLTTSQPIVNDAIYRAVSSWFSLRIWGWADFQVIPEAYLDEGGVHPTDSGSIAMARIWYGQIRANGLIALPAIAPLCGMSGHRPGTVSWQYAPLRTTCPSV